VWAVNISQFDEPIPLSDVPRALGINSTTPKWVERFGLVKVSGGMGTLDQGRSGF
jgi:hypothetical protein